MNTKTRISSYGSSQQTLLTLLEKNRSPQQRMQSKEEMENGGAK
jgi:hypothetical protein